MIKRMSLAIILLISIIPFPAFAEESTERVLIQFDNQIDEKLLEDQRITVHHRYDTVAAASVTAPTSLLSELAKIYEIERDQPVEKSDQRLNWGYQEVLAADANIKGWTGEGIKIGIIDTGIRMDHPDLHIAGGVSFVDGSTTYNDDEGHGTHVAGIIGALDNDIGTVGIAPNADIYAIKTLNSKGNGKLSDVIAGIEWAMEQELDLLNLSFTADESSSLLQTVLDRAYDQGMLIVAASGNSEKSIPSNADVQYPARYESVISVGSIDSKQRKSKFSYYGPSLEFVAPGEDIYSTFTRPNYEKRYGTSMAAPFVTAIAALYKEAYPDLTHIEIRTLMQTNALDLGDPGWDKSFGFGLIQAPTIEPQPEPVVEPEPIEEEPEPSVEETNHSIQPLFSDVPLNQWYTEEIHFLAEQNIITGYGDGRFLPNASVTRAEAITMIGRALGYEDKRQESGYTDISSSHYASGYIETASQNGIITGYPDGRFYPTASVIRGDVATMLDRAYQFEAITSPRFADVAAGKYYTDPIYALYSNRILDGYPDNTFRPHKEITRAEFAVILARVLDERFQR